MTGGETSSEELDVGLGTERELQRRLALASPTDTVRGLSFHNMLDAVRLELGDEAVARCMSQSVEKHYKSFFSYPVGDFLRLQYTAAWMLQARYGTFNNAVRRMSAGLAPGFLSSVVGKAFMLLTKEGPQQLINNMPVAFRAAASFGDISVRWTGERRGVLTTRRDFLIYPNHEGGMVGLFRTLGIPAEVRGRQVGPLENEVEFSWEERP